MSVIQMAAVFKTSQSKGTARLVLLALADVANDEGEITAYARSQSMLARKANCDRASVKRALATLRDLGEIAQLAVGDGRESSDYQITLGTDPDKVRSPQDAPPGGAGCTPTPHRMHPQGAQDAPPIIPSLSVSVRPCPSLAQSTFDSFYAAYPLHVKPGTARKAWATAVKKVPPEAIIAAAARFASEVTTRERRFIPHPATWLNAEQWDDEPGANTQEPTKRGDVTRGNLIAGVSDLKRPQPSLLDKMYALGCTDDQPALPRKVAGA